MPYVTPEQKIEIEAGLPPRNVGELTYCITKQIQRYLKQTKPSYQVYAEVLGALVGAGIDFVVRVLLPYEVIKRVKNGDVWPGDMAP